MSKRNIATPPKHTELITFARNKACPAQLWLSSFPSNNRDLHALPVRPLLLPATRREREEQRGTDSIKRPQMGVGQHN